jgi:aspartyl-tRNA(Asn)/glutamyl-tRNA(Gln) amidotransferase subunit A
LSSRGIFLARPENALPGIPLAVKDSFDTAGLVTTYGSIIFAEHVPERTAAAVERLEAAGYAIVGKANLYEFAYGMTSDNPHFGDVPNPLDAGRIPGGSSGGCAAALAAGLADAALGSDSGGSIRVPAACCGVVGFKPTFGRVPVEGCFPLAPSFDHAGPMARTVEGCTRQLAALDPGFQPSERRALEDVVVAAVWLDEADALVRSRIEETADRFPRRRAIEFPAPDAFDIQPLFAREAAEVHRELFAEHWRRYGVEVRERVRSGFAVSDEAFAAAAAERATYRDRCLEALDGVDLLLTPTMPSVAPRIGQREVRGRELLDALSRLTRPFNALGWPALAMPCGLAEGGMPASVQLVGRPGADGLLLAVGEELERVS